MPIASGARGRPGVLGIPGGAPKIACAGGRLRRPFRSQNLARSNPVITGTTRDSSGAPLGLCTVKLYRTLDDAFLEVTTSDAGGLFSIVALGSPTFYLVAYLPGSPDVAGTTVNTLTAD